MSNCSYFRLTDFEMAAINAIRATFPASVVKGCTFHFRQAISRKVQAAGLRQEYEDRSSAIHDWIRQLMSMTALPVFAVPLIWNWWLRFPPSTESTVTDCKLQDLSDYFGRTWVSGEFPPELWSQFENNGPRTTNAAEGWHNSLNTHFGTPHPSLRVFLHWLQKCQYEVQSRCMQLAAGGHQNRKCWHYVAVDNNLWTAKLQYSMEIGHIFAHAAPDLAGIQLSRAQFRSATETYLRRCNHLLGCN